MMRQLVRLAGPVALVALLSPAALGEEDFKYGMALYKDFQFEDLAIKFFTELKETGSRNDRVSGVFGLGGIKEEQAKAAGKRNDPAEAERFYREARELYDQFMKEAPRDHPERGNVLARIGDIRKKEALELLKQAKAEPDRRQECFGKARSILEELVKPLEEQAKGTMKAYVDFVAGRDPATIRGRDEVTLQKFLNEAVVAMQRLYIMQAELAEVYEKGSAERTAFLDKMIAEIDANSEFWEKEGYPGVLMWLNHMLGRVYALAGKPKEAYEKGFEPLVGDDPGRFDGDARQFVDELRMVAFYLKTKTAFEANDYEAAIRTAEQMFGPAIGPGGGYPDALSDDRGNDAMIFKAKAYLLRAEPDFGAAVQACQKVINAHKGNWPNNARQLLAEIKAKMPREEMLSLGAETLHEMALGDFQLALQESDRGERRKLIERAIAGYNDAIGACRDKDTPYRTRLQHEPACWFELGVCYSKIDLWYEAGFAFEGTLSFFAKDKVGRELADWPEFKEKFDGIRESMKRGARGEDGAADPYARLFDVARDGSSVKELLLETELRLNKCANNLMVSAGRRKRETNSSFDQDRYAKALVRLIEVNPEKRKDLKLHVAVSSKSEAETLFDQGRKAEATAKWAEAGGAFVTAAETIRDKRETSYHLAAKAYYRAMVEAGKLGKKAPELAKKAPDFGREALGAFAEFMREARDKDLVDEELVATREKRMEEAYLVIPTINLTLGNYEETVKAADDYLAREDGSPRNKMTLTWTRYKALKEIALKAVGTDEEAASLEGLAAATEAIDASPAKEFYPKACGIMATVYADAAGRLHKLAEQTGDQGLAGRAKEYDGAFARWSKKVLELRGGDLAALAGTARIFYEQGVYDEARDLYLKALQDYDPDGDGLKDELTGSFFDETAKKAVFDKPAIMKKIREDIAKLKLYVLGEPESERTDKKTGAISPPRERNWPKSSKAIDTLIKFYPMVKGQKDLYDRLMTIRDELRYRLQILAVRLNFSDCSRALARQVKESAPEQSKKYWEEAIDLLEKVREYHWRDNELRTLQAECHRELGQLQEARDLYYEAANVITKYTPEWYKTMGAFSDVVFEMADAYMKKGDKEKAATDYRLAMSHPDMLLVAVDEKEWKEYFPDAREYIAKCEKAIEAAGEEVIIGDVADLSKTVIYDAPSPPDQDLMGQFKNIRQRIKQKTLDASKEKAEMIAAVKRHFTKLAKEAYGRPKVMATMTPPQIKMSQIDPIRKMFLARLLYQAPIQQEALRREVVALGVLKDMADGMSADLLPDDVKKRAIALKLLTADGKKRPKSEIPEDLLKKEDVYGVGPQATTAPKAAEEPEGTEGAEEPEEPIMEPTEDAADRPVEEVAP